ncbi:preprotein translocase subunit YajC [candidate division KSB1 bacterium]
MITDAFAMAGSGGQSGSAGILSFLPLMLIIFILYFLLIRPQAKKQKEHKMMLEAIRKGDKILTSGGIVGTISGFKEKENTLIVKIADNVKIEILKSSVSQVIERGKD